VAWACACACSLFINKKNKSLREPRGTLPGPVRACACSLHINKKKNKCCNFATPLTLREVRGAPPGSLCVFA
jgi:hypothetical protein